MPTKGKVPTVLKDRECMICGRKFNAEPDNKSKVPNRYWFSKTLIKELTGKEGEYWECEECSGFKNDLIIKEKVKTWMEEYWGIRCEDYEESCALCRAWKYFDYIFNFEDSEAEKSNS